MFNRRSPVPKEEFSFFVPWFGGGKDFLYVGLQWGNILQTKGDAIDKASCLRFRRPRLKTLLRCRIPLTAESFLLS